MNTLETEVKIAKKRQEKVSIKNLGIMGFIYACGTELLMMSGLKNRKAYEENYKEVQLNKREKEPARGESNGFASRREFKKARKADRKRRGKK